MAGDAAELTTLARFFGNADGPKVTLGSVKSMIGHTMPAAGAAGLIKAALAVYHGQLPPSLHCETPSERLRNSRFHVRDTAADWSEDTRIAGVNAFGFGGINARVSKTAPPKRRVRASKKGTGPETLGYFSAPTIGVATATRWELGRGNRRR